MKKASPIEDSDLKGIEVVAARAAAVAVVDDPHTHTPAPSCSRQLREPVAEQSSLAREDVRRRAPAAAVACITLKSKSAVPGELLTLPHCAALPAAPIDLYTVGASLWYHQP